MKKRIYKIIHIFLIILISMLIMINLNTLNTYAADPMSIYLEDATGKPGDEITIHLKLANNPGVRILGGKISFDRSKLDYIHCELQNLERATNKDIQYNESTGNIVFYATTMTNDNDPITDNDVIAIIKFRIKADATGTSEVKIAMDDVSAGINQEITDYTQKNAIVTIDGTTSNGDTSAGADGQEGSSSNGENGNSESVEGQNNGTNSNNNTDDPVKNENQEEGKQENKESKTSPTTGDIAVGVLVALLIISAIGITIILIKRKKKK